MCYSLQDCKELDKTEHVCMLSHSVVSDSAILWTVAHQAPLSLDFSRQEYWSRLPFLPPGDLFDPGIEPTSQVLAGEFFTNAPPGKPIKAILVYLGLQGQF